jgi:hypothetical protein
MRGCNKNPAAIIDNTAGDSCATRKRNQLKQEPIAKVKFIEIASSLHSPQ